MISDQQKRNYFTFLSINWTSSLLKLQRPAGHIIDNMICNLITKCNNNLIYS